MHIYVPSTHRASVREVSYGPLPRLPKSWMKKVTMVVDGGEIQAYRDVLRSMGLDWVRLVSTPRGLRGIGPTRAWCGGDADEMGEESFVMMDDDVDFLVRRGADDWRLRAQHEEETHEMLLSMQALMERSFAMVGISSREGNNRVGVGSPMESNMISVNTRIMRVFGVRTDVWLQMEHGRVEVMEDFDLTLQMLRAGHMNCCLYYWANGQRQTNAPGGCSTYRTHEVQDRSARRLAELHPGLVRLRQKQNKTDAAGLGTRTEVTVMWKKAFCNG